MFNLIPHFYVIIWNYTACERQSLMIMKTRVGLILHLKWGTTSKKPFLFFFKSISFKNYLRRIILFPSLQNSFTYLIRLIASSATWCLFKNMVAGILKALCSLTLTKHEVCWFRCFNWLFTALFVQSELVFT